MRKFIGPVALYIRRGPLRDAYHHVRNRVWRRKKAPSREKISSLEVPAAQPPAPVADPIDAATGATIDAAIDRYRGIGEITAATLLELKRNQLGQIQGYFLPNEPINVILAPQLAIRPSLNILIPSIQKKHATGGPNTAYALGMLLAKEGVAIRFLATDLPLDQNLSWTKEHILGLTGLDPDHLDVQFIDASDRSVPTLTGINDSFMATAWWTAHIARAASRFTRQEKLYYLIQDYETLFYGANENYADAEATYSFDHFPIINSSFLRDHMVEHGVGRFADPDFANAACVFQPAVDTRQFFPTERRKNGPRRLLFYARPTIARRNLFGLGVAALRAAVETGVFDGEQWEFIGMGEPFSPFPLGKGHELKPAPWLNLDAYAEQMRGADILLALMLSPHPSYPPLEMAACGGVTVTTIFGSKTAERLERLSPNIIGVAPSIESLVKGLSRGVRMWEGRNRDPLRAESQSLPRTWNDSLAHILPRLLGELEKSGVIRDKHTVRLPEPGTIIRVDETGEGGPDFSIRRVRERRGLLRGGTHAIKLSLVTTVYNTSPLFIADLAHTVFGQTTPPEFEWLILDNGSSDPDTLQILSELSKHPKVRHARVESNLGIVGGMRWCLENATGAYILPVDSDDLLYPDALHVIATYLEQSGLPAILYTDEDKTDGRDHFHSYIKPDWDPVLFIHSCYVAHLTALNRERALELGCYTDPETEGSHDWDSFVRFACAGLTPVHVPEILYSWRVHSASTSGNIGSKPYVARSQRAVLERYLEYKGMSASLDVAPAPLFPGAPDWRFRPRPVAQANAESKPARILSASIPSLVLSDPVTRDQLSQALRQAPDCPYVHLVEDGVEIQGNLSDEEAGALFSLFEDAVIVGGRVHDGRRVQEAGFAFGYMGAIGAPDSGRDINDPGFFAQMWKPHSVGAVSVRHCYIARFFFQACLQDIPASISMSLLGPWLGALARRDQKRVIYSPYMEALCQKSVELAERELAYFNASFGDFANDHVGYPLNLDRGGTRPYQPVDKDSKPKRPLLSYPAYLENHVLRRMTPERHKDREVPSLSLITTVYSKTDADLLRIVAKAVQAQTMSPIEWIVLAHGPVSSTLERLLSTLAEQGAVTFHAHPVNLGIHGGLRFCLERARGDFVLALDADDVLTQDAVALLSQAAALHPGAAVIYTDEDLLIDERYCHPYLRPDFDPALLLSHSYVWHAIAFRREIALKLGAFSNEESQYAQDWDLLVRFYMNGYEPVHLPEIIYHWRQHKQSTSHSGKIFEGTLTSIKAVLGMTIDRSSTKRLYEVAPYPLDTGMQDFYVKRARDLAPRTELINLGPGPTRRLTFPFSARKEIPEWRDQNGCSALLDALETSDADVVATIGSGLDEIEEDGLWQALKQLELIKTAVAVGGPLIGLNGRVLVGPTVLLRAAKLVDPARGRSARDPGPFSLCLKPHCVSALPIDLVVSKRSFLLDALRNRPRFLGLRSLGAWLGGYAEAKKLRLVYEPLLRGHVFDEARLIADGVDGLNLAWKTQFMGDLHVSEGVPVRGLAAFERHRMLHET